jgi:hypothetical protein
MAREVMNEPERYEQLIAFLDNNLPSPVERQELADGSMRFTGGDPQEVIAELTDSSVIVSAFGAVWETPYSLTPRPRRVGIIKWRRLPENAMLAALTALIRGAREARAASFRICERCGRKTAPEWLDTDTVCHACARQEHVH